MLKRVIPSTGEQIPVIGLGTFRSFDKRLNRRNRRNLTKVLKLFLNGGGSVIDSSPMYGRAEATIGSLLADMGMHDRTFIATKVWTSGKSRGIAEMEDSLTKLQANSVALIQVHNLVDCDTQVETLRDWKEAGRIKYLGITHYGVSGFGELIRRLNQGGIDFVQFPYSIAAPNAEERLLPLCRELGIATLINRPFEQSGLFSRTEGRALPILARDLGCDSWSQFFLKYIIGQPGVTCTIPATASPDHMCNNLAAGAEPLPTTTQQLKMRNILADL